jgi:hypothetical protein
VNVPHASRVFENFYGLRGFGPGIMAAIGSAELLLILAFVLGYQKRISYGRRPGTSRYLDVLLVSPSISTRSTTCCSLPPGRCWRRVSPSTGCATWTHNGRSALRARVADRRREAPTLGG